LNVLFNAFLNSDANIVVFLLSPKKQKNFSRFSRLIF